MSKNSNIIPYLYIGSAPYENVTIDLATVLVLCAMEYQPPSSAFLGMILLRCPIADEKTLTFQQLTMVKETAIKVAAYVQNGTSVLCTCLMGLNRSALVVGLAMRKLGYTGDDTIDMIRKYRGENALFNEYFEALIRQMRVKSTFGVLP